MKIARMIVTDGFSFSPAQAEKAVLLFLEKLEGKVDWITASGCFLGATFPDSPDIIAGWDSSPGDAEVVYGYGNDLVKQMMTPELKKALKAKSKFFSFGIDLKTPTETFKGLHAELVTVWDCKKNRVAKNTGKTYPCHDQENHMYHTVDYGTHFMEACGERIMLLGCNDLNIYYKRGEDAQKAGSNRHKRMHSFRKAAKKFNPTVVLQHPHYNDFWKIWYNKWCNLRKLLKIKSFSSSICYGRWPRKGEEPQPIRGTLAEVISRSHGGAIDNGTGVGQSIWPIQDVLVSHRELAIPQP